MSKRDYYATLGVSKESTDDEIKRAYRKLASTYHPDKIPGENGSVEKTHAEAKFKEVKEAYECLSDPEQRMKYDSPGFERAFGNFHGNQQFRQEDINDIFSHMFKFNNGHFQGHNAGPTIYAVTISLADAYSGRVITVDGNVTLTIPKGMRSGTKLFSSGKLYRMDVQPHPKFKRSNDDLLVDLEINAVEAMIGVGIVLDHLDGTKLHFDVPAGIQQSQIVKLTGKGMKHPEFERYGDMLIRVTIITPRNLTDLEKNAIKTLQHRESINI